MLRVLAASIFSLFALGPGLQNGDFEKDRVGESPQGWFVPGPATKAGFLAQVSEDRPHEGERCARLFFDGKGRPKVFGNLMQSFDAAHLRGKRVRLRAAVRVEKADRAQMWLRVDRSDEKRGFFDNMGDRPITSSAWKAYTIEGDVDAEATRVNFGLMVFGTGAAYLDGVTLEVVGDALPAYAPEAARPLRGKALANLVAFAKLYGYVRHFHPSDEAEAADWEAIAVSGVKAIEKAKNARELAAALNELFLPVAPTVQVFRRGRTPEPHGGLAPPAGAGKRFVRAWRHRGFGQEQSAYSSERRKKPFAGELPEGFRDPREVFAGDLGELACHVPLTLYADEDGTLPRAETEPVRALPANYTPTGEDRATRLADVVIAWNVMQHFYPYFDVVETDWEAELERALESAAADGGERAFLDTLRRLIAALQDGHGNVQHASDRRAFGLPFLWDWAEGKLVVTHVPDGMEKPAPGDVVLAIEGVPVDEAFAEVAALISGATPQWIRARARTELRRGQGGTSMRLTFLRAKKRYTEDVELVPFRDAVSESRPEKVAELEPRIWYVDLGRVSDEDFEVALPELAAAKGIVFDMRGYPGGIGFRTFFPHLVDEPATSAQWHFPIVTRPDREELSFERGGEWDIRPEAPFLAAKKAFLIHGGAISYAESCMGIVEHYGIGALVGEATAGTNGNINPFQLPGGYRVVFTGMKVLKHDGSQHHGVGILPTVPVARTIAGVAAGRDEVLARALELVRE